VWWCWREAGAKMILYLNKGGMFKQACLCLVALIILAVMVRKLPGEAATIRALDLELTLHDKCDCGEIRACELLTETSAILKSKVESATKDIQGACLFVSEDEIAVRSSSGAVSNVSLRANMLLD